MDSTAKSSKSVTPKKEPQGFQPKNQENSNPNVSKSTSSSSPLTKSATKSQKSASKNQSVGVYAARNRITERKFVFKSKKNAKNEKVSVNCKCKARSGGNVQKCLCVAYETLRASQEEFFKNKDGVVEEGNEVIDKENESSKSDKRAEIDVEEEKEIEKGFMAQKDESLVELGTDDRSSSESAQLGQLGVSTIKRRRDRLLEAARNSIPEAGTGAVMHLVKAFERLRTLPEPKEADKKEEVEKSKSKAIQWALPGLQLPNVPEFDSSEVHITPDSPSSLCSSDLVLTSQNLGLDPRASVSSSWDSSHGSISSRTSNGSRRSRRNSSESCGTMRLRRWKKKQMKITSQKPFQLRTEQRGKMKEEEFMKKLQELMIEEEKMRIPIAQGLPWTTDEPENLIKPPVKEITRPVDLKLHSDIRAVERAEFDHQVLEKLSFIEQYKMERERQQKLAEEEEIRRLRKELVPKAQPMPYFDRPFIPRRSTKHPTVPKEPKFHIPQHKKMKSCLSWSEMSTFTYQD